MRKYIIRGRNKLKGIVSVSGAKNVALKAIVAASLTGEEVEISNVPLISDFFVMTKLIEEIGGKVVLADHKARVRLEKITSTKIPLDIGAKIRTSSMFLASLLARSSEAVIPNPGGCRIGARPIDRHIEGLEKMGARISYHSTDGYFYAKTKELVGTDYTFEKNTHTGTETLILAASLAKGKTVLRNAASEPEIDNLIDFLNKMGAKIKRIGQRTIVIDGVKKLNGASFKIMNDRNEQITFAIAGALTGGEVFIKDVDFSVIGSFLDNFKNVGGDWETIDGATRFFIKEKILSSSVTTQPYPGFMTDWQGPWAILMTQASGESVIHETIYESRFGYVEGLEKMGASIELFSPKVEDPASFYNFNYKERTGNGKYGAKIFGPCTLHNGVLDISDLRAGATLVIAALIAKGESVIFGVEHIERGYEDFPARLKNLGADIKMIEEQI